MYAELDLRFKRPTTSARAKIVITEVAGENLISVSDAVARTALAGAPISLRAVLAAERVVQATTVIYFMQGDDIIKAHIVARSWSEIRKECARITRQLSNKVGRLLSASASVFVETDDGVAIILAGEKKSFLSRMLSTVTEKFLSKFAPAATAFALAATFLSGTPFVQSAAIGAVAACVGALVECALAARRSGQWEWNWKD